MTEANSVLAVTMPGPQLSIVLPIFNEAELLPQLYARLRRVLDQLRLPCELIFVDDGSRDASLAQLRAMQRHDGRILIVELSRNWGHQAALSAGLATAQGDAVVMMDADLQDPPELIAELVAAWQAGAQVVVAERRSRAEHGPRRWLTAAFYRLFGYLSDFPLPDRGGVFCLLGREPAQELRRLGEVNRYLPGLRAWIGFPAAAVAYDRAGRERGRSRQSLWRLLRYGFDAVFSFSYKPMRLSILIGLVIAGLALLGAAVVVIERLRGAGLFHQPVIVGYTSTIFAVLFLGGVQLVCLGLIGEYIGRIYDEVKARPLYIVRRLHRAEPDRAEAERGGSAANPL